MNEPSMDPPLAAVVLALADDEHMVGARHTAWIGLGPFLEEDLAFCSIAQDELGHAIALYEMLPAAQASGIDAFGLLREPSAYRSSWLAEWECTDWADSLVRQWLYDRAETLRWEWLREMSSPPLADLAARALSEESFHLAHAEHLLCRVMPSTEEAKRRLVASTSRFLGMSDNFWVDLDLGLRQQWEQLVAGDLARWGVEGTALLNTPQVAPADRSVRSPGFDAFHAELTEVVALDPSAIW